MNLVTKDLVQTQRWLSENERLAVIAIIKASFASVDPLDYIAKYFDGSDAFQRKLRLYFSGEQVVGYCLLTFTDEHDVTIIRASAGFLPDYRKGGNTFQFSLVESVKCWLRRPWRKTFYADTMLSPAMYRAIAKHSGIVWPHPDHSAPKAVFERFNADGELSAEVNLRCLVPVNRMSNYSEQELAAFEASDKLEIQYYRRLNPQFNQGMALFVIIPVHLTQLLKTALKMLKR